MTLTGYGVSATSVTVVMLPVTAAPGQLTLNPAVWLQLRLLTMAALGATLPCARLTQTAIEKLLTSLSANHVRRKGTCP